MLGHLIRICERTIASNNIHLSSQAKEILQKVQSLHAQSVLNKREKEKYKKDNKILYSYHATEVECIGKEKLNKPYNLVIKYQLQ